jgi:hypothetical protein
MVVRLFGGWEFQASDANSRIPAEVGYRKGVPMGGDLLPAPDGGTPRFLVAALKDPIGANLDRIQIVKAFYYARVIEIPTPRWVAYDAKHFGLEPPAEAELTVTERAYTSPIWYTP